MCRRLRWLSSRVRDRSAAAGRQSEKATGKAMSSHSSGRNALEQRRLAVTACPGLFDEILSFGY
jgi:hypothetical protein